MEEKAVTKWVTAFLKWEVYMGYLAEIQPPGASNF